MSIETWSQKDQDEWGKITAPNQKRLESEEIDPRYPYSKQTDAIKSCLHEAFGEYSKGIKITNSFLIDLQHFMKQVHAVDLYKGAKNGTEWKNATESAVGAGNRITEYVLRHGGDTDDKMEEDLRKKGKSQGEIDGIIKVRYDGFLELLRARVQYEVK